MSPQCCHWRKTNFIRQCARMPVVVLEARVRFAMNLIAVFNNEPAFLGTAAQIKKF